MRTACGFPPAWESGIVMTTARTSSGRISAGRRAVLAAVLPALALAACNQQPAASTADGNGAAPLASLPATVPMTAAPATPLAAAPPVAALPAAAPARIVRVADPRQSYAYADRAYDMSQAVDTSPPDYGFDYGGVQPWAWHADDGSTEVAEPVGDGYRYYYYEAGARRPYLVRDGGYAYGYDDGSLAAVYGPDGRVLPPEQYAGRHADHAGRYLVRGAALIATAAVVAHYGISAGDWRERRADFSSERARQEADQARQTDWRAYHGQHAAREHDHWRAEEAARDDRSRRFEHWRQDDFRGPPPSAPARDDRGDQPADMRNRQQQEQQRGARADERQAMARRQQADRDRAAVARRQQDMRDARQREADAGRARQEQQERDDRFAGQRRDVGRQDARQAPPPPRSRLDQMRARADDAQNRERQAQDRVAMARARAGDAGDRSAPHIEATFPQPNRHAPTGFPDRPQPRPPGFNAGRFDAARSASDHAASSSPARPQQAQHAPPVRAAPQEHGASHDEGAHGGDAHRAGSHDADGGHGHERWPRRSEPNDIRLAR